MAWPASFTGARTIHDPTTNPARPSWAPEGETTTELSELPEQDLPEVLSVADIRRHALTAAKQRYGDWARWESLRVKARVNRDDGCVWVLLQRIGADAGLTRVVLRERWLYFEEFLHNYPRAAQVVRPVSEGCYQAVQWEGWMEDDWEEEQLRGVEDDDTELVSWLGDLGHRREVMEQGLTRACWYAKFGR
jgi:hypothetical protein